ncbi:unnamed protein product, partial [Prorocentrum cordatum]
LGAQVSAMDFGRLGQPPSRAILDQRVCFTARRPRIEAAMAPKKAEGGEAKAKGAKKASKVSKAVKQSVSRKVKKTRTNVHFFRPKTLLTKRAPKYARKSVAARDKMDKYRIIECPVTTESAMKKIEEINTLVFLVDIQASPPLAGEPPLVCRLGQARALAASAGPLPPGLLRG